MGETYTTAQLMFDVMQTISVNAPPIIQAAILVSVANFVIGWFMDAMSQLAKAGRS